MSEKWLVAMWTITLAWAGVEPVVGAPVPFSDGSVFLETFTNFMFDNEPVPGATATSRFTGADVAFHSTNTARLFNDSSTSDGTYDAVSDTLTGAGPEYVMELTFSHNAALDDTNGDGTGLTRGMLLRPLDFGGTYADLILGVKDNDDGTTWDIRVMHAGNPSNGADGGDLAGLTLARNQFHHIALHHKGNAAHEIDLYVDGAPVGTYIDVSPSTTVKLVQVGSISDAIGFTDSYLDEFRIGLPITGLPGDFNNDGQYTPADIDLLCAAIEAGSPTNPYDVDGDNDVDLADLTYEIETIIGTNLGDTDLDLDVDLSDLGNLATNFGAVAGIGWAGGDTDCDGDVDLSDLGNLATNYGLGEVQAMADFQQQLSVVPEPTALVLLGLVAMSSMRRRR